MRPFLPFFVVAVACAAPDRDALRDRCAAFAALHERHQVLLGERAELKQRVDALDAELRALAASEAPDAAAAERLSAEHERAQGAYAEFERPSGPLWKSRVELEAKALELEAALDAALDAEDDPELRLWRGELLARLERYRAALPDAEAAAFARPEDPRALRLLGRCAATRNRFADAAGLFGEAQRRDPSAEGWALLAVAHYCSNQFQAAREAWARVEPAEVPARLRRRCRALLEPVALAALEQAWTEELRLRAEHPGPRVALTLADQEVVLELFPDAAPVAVAWLLERVRQGQLSDVPVSRVLENLAVVVGASSTLDPAEQVEVDPARARRHHFRGSVALEHPGDGVGYGPGLLVALTPAPRLDARHLVIGRVVSGQAALDAAREGQRLTAARVLE